MDRYCFINLGKVPRHALAVEERMGLVSKFVFDLFNDNYDSSLMHSQI